MMYLIDDYKGKEYNINKIIKKCDLYKIKKYDIDDCGLLTVYESVYFSNKKFKKIPLNFKEVFGDFSISRTPVIDLWGSPIIVHDSYIIMFTCISSLKSCPNEIGGNLNCYGNNKLTNFIDFPKYIKKNVSFVSCNLKNLYKCNNIIYGGFNIIYNSFLKTLKYGPQRVDGYYICSNCNLLSLYGSPEYVGDDFYCSNNNIKNLKYSPKYIGGCFDFSDNKIKDFYNFPDYVGGKIYCKNTPLYEIWRLFEDKNYIEYFNQMNIITDKNKINIKKLNLFLKSINKEPVESINGYINYKNN